MSSITMVSKSGKPVTIIRDAGWYKAECIDFEDERVKEIFDKWESAYVLRTSDTSEAFALIDPEVLNQLFQHEITLQFKKGHKVTCERLRNYGEDGCEVCRKNDVVPIYLCVK